MWNEGHGDNPITRLLQTTAYLTLGIAPVVNTVHDFNRILATLPPDEARKMKRKFRKLWRKFAKKPSRHVSPTYVKQMGLGAKQPTRKQKSARKVEVRRRILAEVVRPMQEDVNKSPQNT
jgi:hypothetical protein